MKALTIATALLLLIITGVGVVRMVLLELWVLELLRRVLELRVLELLWLDWLEAEVLRVEAELTLDALVDDDGATEEEAALETMELDATIEDEARADDSTDVVGVTLSTF